MEFSSTVYHFYIVSEMPIISFLLPLKYKLDNLISLMAAHHDVITRTPHTYF